jgi:hypothetical protein
VFLSETAVHHHSYVHNQIKLCYGQVCEERCPYIFTFGYSAGRNPAVLIMTCRTFSVVVFGHEVALAHSAERRRDGPSSKPLLRDDSPVADRVGRPAASIRFRTTTPIAACQANVLVRDHLFTLWVAPGSPLGTVVERGGITTSMSSLCLTVVW